MKIIYDEAKAIRDKQKIDAETPSKNRKAKINNTILIIALLLGVSLVAFCLNYGRNYLKSITPDNGAHEFLDILYWVGMLLVWVLATLKFTDVIDYVQTAKERYPENVDYYLATKDKTVLNASATLTNEDSFFGDNYALILTLEDANHVVSKECVSLTFFRTQTITNIEEVSVYLDEKVIHIPYNHRATSAN